MSRFTNRLLVINNDELYDEFMAERDVKFFRQYETPNFVYPTASEIRELKTIKHVWKKGDRFFKLAHEHYGDSEFWWIIAWYNKMPTESHAKIGTVVFIPKPLPKVLKYLRNKR